MKLKQKIMAAAMASALSGPAFADITLGGNGELFWTVFDFNGNQAYTRDLGVLMDSFLTGPTSTYTFTPDATFNTFLAGVAPANVGSLTFNITAGDVSGGRRFLTTGGNIPTTGYSTTVMGNLGSGFNTFVGGQNALEAHGGATDNLSAITTPADSSAYAAGPLWNSTFGGKGVAGTDNTVALNQTASFYLISQATQAVGGSVAVATLGVPSGPAFQAAFDSGTNTLTVQAVPEPSTYAMLGLGLMGIGFAVRRGAKRA